MPGGSSWWPARATWPKCCAWPSASPCPGPASLLQPQAIRAQELTERSAWLVEAWERHGFRSSPRLAHLAVGTAEGRLAEGPGRRRSQRWCCSPAGSTPPPAGDRAVRGFACHALTVRLRPAPRASSSRPRGASPRRSGVASTACSASTSRHRRLGPDRRPRRAQGPRVDEIGAGIPVTYVPARNTIFLSYRARLGRGARRARPVHRGQRARLPAAIPIAGPSSSRRSSRWRTSRPGPASGHEPLPRPRAPDRADQGRDHPRRSRARCRLRHHLLVLRARAGRRRLRPCDACPLRRKGFADARLGDPVPTAR